MANLDIYTIEDLASLNTGSGAITGTHTLMRSLDFNDDASYANPANKTTYTTGSGWEGIGKPATRYYAGTFEGQGFTISNMFTKDRSYSGIFGLVDACTIRNVGIINPSINVASTGNYVRVGALVGTVDASATVLIENCYSTGGNIGADDYVGGLIGRINSFASGTTTVRNCYSTVAVTERGSLQDGFGFGSFVGSINLVNGGTQVFIEKCWGSGAVTTGASTNTGGFNGFNNASGSIADCFWDTQTTGKATSVGGTGKTTNEMKTLATFSAWDISAETAYNYPTKWFMRDGVYNPKLAIEYKRYDTSAFINS